MDTATPQKTSSGLAALSTASPSSPRALQQKIREKFDYLNNTSSICCVVNKEGEILFTNRSWATFVLENDKAPTPRPIQNSRYWPNSTSENNNDEDKAKSQSQSSSEIESFFRALPSLFEAGAEAQEEEGKESEKKRKKMKVKVAYPFSSDLYECEVMAKAKPSHFLHPNTIVIEHELTKLRKKQRRTDSQIQALKTVKEVSDLYPILSLLTSHCCLLDLNGKIIFTNPAWNVFCKENGGVGHHYVGTNYLELPPKNPCTPLSASAASGGDECVSETKEEDKDDLDDDEDIANEIQEGFSFIEGLRRLIDGHTLQEVQLVYPCHSPSEKRFFLATATNLFIGEKRVIFVSHELLSKTQKRQKSPLSELASMFQPSSKKKKENSETESVC